MSKIYSRPRIKIPKIFLATIGNKRSKKKQYLIKVIIIFIISLITVKVILNAILPIFETLCEEKAKAIATIVSNEQATNVMREHKYEELFTIEKDNSGNIKMIRANINPINEIISDVAVKIQNTIDEKGKENISIPAGSFTGIKFLAGEGPRIKLTIATSGNVETDLRSEFIAQGINQTLHRVYLQVNCQVKVLTPFESIAVNISNQVLLIENVIIGNIPNTYYNLNGITEDNAVDLIE